MSKADNIEKELEQAESFLNKDFPKVIAIAIDQNDAEISLAYILESYHQSRLSEITDEEMEEIALKYWEKRNKENKDGAVKWLKNHETGTLVIITRAEYSGTLLNCINNLDPIDLY